ncbi:LysR family transcriptional regulator [Microbacterium sp. Mu-80]|uniref:LysR family transcriptional regulator n=1 Tax=Microbacterium bandirmense TaxID=3122050 RepID=A0ABU8LG72_9MICO
MWVIGSSLREARKLINGRCQARSISHAYDTAEYSEDHPRHEEPDGDALELRDIEVFLTLADELHFGRTAERLHLSQARVSQIITEYERQIGGSLFDRSNRRDVRLTPVGARLRDDLTPVYGALRDSLNQAKLAVRGFDAELRVGLMPFNVPALHGYWEAFTTRHPHYELRLRYASFTDPFGSLRRGEIDVLVTWLPVDEPDLTIGPTLFTDTHVLAVAATHELASRSSVPVEALADFAHVMVANMPETWENGYLPFRTPGGKTIKRVEAVTNADELLQLVSTGEIIHPFPAHVMHYWSLPHIRWLPMPDLSPLTYVLVWRTDAESDPIRAFARTVDDLGPITDGPV